MRIAIGLAMLPERLGLRKTFLIAGLLALAAFFFTTLSAPAETSVKKLEKKLHKLEKKSGKVFYRTLDVTFKVGLEVLVDCLDADDDSAVSQDFRTKHPPAQSNSAHIPASLSHAPAKNPSDKK